MSQSYAAYPFRRQVQCLVAARQSATRSRRMTVLAWLVIALLALATLHSTASAAHASDTWEDGPISKARSVAVWTYGDLA